MRSKRSRIIGYVDHAGGGLIRGWAADLRSPERRLALDVFRHGVFLGCARAGGLRPDLRAQGIGDGLYGFVFHSSALAEDCAADGLSVVAPDAVGTQLVIGNGAPASSPVGHAFRDIRDLLRPLIGDAANASCAEMPATIAASGVEKRRLDILFAQHSDKAGSAFAAHIAAKYGRPPPSDDPEFWRWYLSVYGIEQSARVPLSIEDIAQIEHAGLPTGESCESRASPPPCGAGQGWGAHAYWPIAKHGLPPPPTPPQGVGEPRSIVQRAVTHLAKRPSDRAFAWVHESRRLQIEDCLVADHAADALAAVSWTARCSAFPLSVFMRRLRREHALLRNIAVMTASGRITLYLVLMLLALREVHYLRYMPPVWVDRMLEPGLFGRTQQALFGRFLRPLSPQAYRAHVAAAGFDLSSRRFTTCRFNGHRIVVPTCAKEAAVDIQMVGPFRQSLGLAESCHRVARALQATGLDVNFVDYPVGSVSRPASPEVALGEARAARVNILHLNAEEVPEAMSYRAGALSGGHTILIPYWELNRPSDAHRLGLKLVDEVWCASRFLADVFAGEKPVVHIGMSYDGRALAREHPHKEFTVLTVSDALSWTQRKNVLGAVEAFQAAFADTDARLIVKTRNVQSALGTAQADDWRNIVARCGDDPRITLLDKELPTDAQRALLAGPDCLLSLHRAEGLGLDILDALYLGTPVVATAYSGNMDVCNAETAWLVDYDLVPVPPESYVFVEPGHMWAEPQLASAVTALRVVRDDAVARTRKIAAARAYVEAYASPNGLAARLSHRLREILGRRAA